MGDFDRRSFPKELVRELKRQKPRLQCAVLPLERMALRVQHAAKVNGSGTLDLIRSAGRVATAALPSVLSGHCYCAVIESLSKPKFAIFLD
jgi:hypothetical protein